MDCDESTSEDGEISENEDTTSCRNELAPGPVENEVEDQLQAASYECPECNNYVPEYGFPSHLNVCLNYPTSRRKARKSATGTYCELSEAEGSHELSQNQDVQNVIQEQSELEGEFKSPQPVKKSKKKSYPTSRRKARKSSSGTYCELSEGQGSHEPSQKQDVRNVIQEQSQLEEEFKSPQPVKKSKKKKPPAKKKDTLAEPEMDQGRGKKHSKKRRAETSGSESEFESPSEQKKMRKKIQRKAKYWTDFEKLPQPVSDAELESPWSKKKFKKFQEPKMKDWMFGEREAGEKSFRKRMEKKDNFMRARSTKSSVRSNTTKDDFKENRLESSLVHNLPQMVNDGENKIPDLVCSPLKNFNREEQATTEDNVATKQTNQSADITDCREEITRKSDDTTTKTLQGADTEPQPPAKWVVKLSPTPVPKPSPKAKKKKAARKKVREFIEPETEKVDESKLLLASKQASCSWQIRAQSEQQKREDEWNKLFGQPDIFVTKETLQKLKKQRQKDDLHQLFMDKLEASDSVPQTNREANVSEASTTKVVSTTKDEHLQNEEFSEAATPKVGVRRRLLFDVPKIEEPAVKQKPKAKSSPIAGPSGISKKRPFSEHEEPISDPKMEPSQSKKPFDGIIIIKLKEKKVNELESIIKSTVIKQQEPVEKLQELAAGDTKPKDPESNNQSSEEKRNRKLKKSGDNQTDYKVVTTDVSVKCPETKGMELAKHPQKEPEEKLLELTPITKPKATESNNQFSKKQLNKESKKDGDFQENISDPKMKPKQLNETLESSEIKLKPKRQNKNKHRQAEERRTEPTKIKANEPATNRKQREPTMKQDNTIKRCEVRAFPLEPKPKSTESNNQLSEKQLNMESKKSGDNQEKMSDPKMKPKQLKDTFESTDFKLKRKRDDENKHRLTEKIPTDHTIIKPREPEADTDIKKQKEPDMKQEIIRPASTFDTKSKATKSNSQLSTNQLNKESEKSGDYQRKISGAKMKPKQCKESLENTNLKLKLKKQKVNNQWQTEEVQTDVTTIMPNEPENNMVTKEQREPDMKHEQVIMEHEVPASTFNSKPKNPEFVSQLSEKQLYKESKKSEDYQKISDSKLKPKQFEEAVQNKHIKLKLKRHKDNKQWQTAELRIDETVINPNEPESQTVINKQREPDMKREELIIKHTVPASTFDTKAKKSLDCQEKIIDHKMKHKQLKETLENTDNELKTKRRISLMSYRQRQMEKRQPEHTIINPHAPASNNAIKEQTVPEMKQELLISCQVPASTFDTTPKTTESNSKLSEKMLNKESKISGDYQEKVRDPRMKPKHLKETLERSNITLKQKIHQESKHGQTEEITTIQTITNPNETESNTAIKEQRESDVKQLIIRPASTFNTKPKSLESTDVKLKEKRHENKHRQTEEKQPEHTMIKPNDPENNTGSNEQRVPVMKQEELIIRRQVPAFTNDTKPNATESNSKLSEKMFNKKSEEKISDSMMKPKQLKETVERSDIKLKHKGHNGNIHGQTEEIRTVETIIKPNEMKSNTVIKDQREPDVKQAELIRRPTSTFSTKPKKPEYNSQLSKEQANTESKKSSEEKGNRKPKKSGDNQNDYKVVTTDVNAKCPETKSKELAEHPEKQPEKNLVKLTSSHTKLKDPESNNQSSKEQANVECKVVTTDVSAKCPETKSKELAEHPQKEPEKNLVKLKSCDTKIKDPESNNQSSKEQANIECKAVTTDVSTKYPGTKGIELDKNREVLASISKQLDMKPNDPECSSVVDLTEEPDSPTSNPSKSITPITPQVAYTTTISQQKKKTTVDPKDYPKGLTPKKKEKRHLKKESQQTHCHRKEVQSSVELTPLAGSLSTQNIESNGGWEEEHQMEPQKISEDLLCQETDMEPLDFSTKNSKKLPEEVVCEVNDWEPLDLTMASCISASTSTQCVQNEPYLTQIETKPNDPESIDQRVEGYFARRPDFSECKEVVAPLNLSMASCISASTSTQKQITQCVQKEPSLIQIETKPNDPESIDQRVEGYFARRPDFSEPKEVVVYLSKPPSIKILQNILLQTKTDTGISELELLGLKTFLGISPKAQETEYESPNYESHSKEPPESQDTEDEVPDAETLESQDTEDTGFLSDIDSKERSKDMEMNYSEESPEPELQASETIVIHERECSKTEEEDQESELGSKESRKESVRNHKKDADQTKANQPVEVEHSDTEIIVIRPESNDSEKVAESFLEKPSSNLLMNELQTKTNKDISDIDYHSPETIKISETEDERKDFELDSKETSKHGVRNWRLPLRTYKNKKLNYSRNKKDAELKSYQTEETVHTEIEIIVITPDTNHSEEVGGCFLEKTSNNLLMNVMQSESNTDISEIALQSPETILDIEAKSQDKETDHPDPELDSKDSNETRKPSVRNRRPPMWKYKDMELDYWSRSKQSRPLVSYDNKDKNWEKQNENVEPKEVDRIDKHRIHKHSSRQTKKPKKRCGNPKRKKSLLTKLRKELRSVRVRVKMARMALLRKCNQFRTEQDELKEKYSNLIVAHENLQKEVDQLKTQYNRSNNTEYAEHIPPVEAGPSWLGQDFYDMDIEVWSPPKDTNDVDGQPVACEERGNCSQPELPTSVEEREVDMDCSDNNDLDAFLESLLVKM